MVLSSFHPKSDALESITLEDLVTQKMVEKHIGTWSRTCSFVIGNIEFPLRGLNLIMCSS